MSDHAACERKIADLETEIVHLKRRLAIRGSREMTEPKIKDPIGFLANLAPQDRAYMERKMGMRKR